MLRRRLAILTTHQIQYQTPWFRALASHPDIDLDVLYCHNITSKEQSEAGFGVEFDWDVSLLDGYSYRFLNNVASQPSVSGFWGLDTPEVGALLTQERYDAVIINGWHYKSAWQTMRACWKNRIPAMVRSDSHLFTQRGLTKRVMKWPFYSWFIPRLDACLAVGVWSSDYFRHYGAKQRRIFIVPHVIDEELFRAQWSRLMPLRNELRTKWKLDNDSVVFLFAGKFTNQKRPLTFVKSLARARDMGARVAGLMVGDGPLRSTCQEFVNSRDIPIRFAGFLNQSRITEAYVAADALVLPSDARETWGLVVNEAMTCGLPSFVSDKVGCGPDLIVPGDTGDVFSQECETALSDMLLRYSREPDRLADMGQKAKKKVEQYSVDCAVASTLRAISAVARG